RLSDATREGTAAAGVASARLAAKSDAQTRMNCPSGRVEADDVLVVLIEGVLDAGIEFEPWQQAVADPGRGQRVGAEPHARRRKQVEILVGARTDPGETRAPAHPAGRAKGGDIGAVARTAYLAHRRVAGRDLLACPQPCIAGAQVEPWRGPPAEVRLDPRAPARPVGIGDAGEEGDRIEPVDDFVAQPRGEIGEAGLDRTLPPFGARFPAARALRPEVRIAGERVREEA